MTDKFVVGIDGGGTSTTAWVSLASGLSDPMAKPLGKATTGSSNSRRSVSVEQAFDNIELAVNQACQAGGIPRQSLSVAVLALAGCDRAEDKLAYASLAEQRNLAEFVSVENDGVPLLALAARTGPAVAIVSGTGSIGIARDADGIIRRSGGWGYLFGDEGSGFGLGVDALRAVAQADDGRGNTTKLTAAVCEFYNVEKPQDLISAVYDDPAHQQSVAKLASNVIKLSDAGDPVATQIVERGKHELLTLLMSLVEKSRLQTESFSLALAGGVFVHSESWFGGFESAARAAWPQIANVNLVENPVSGAVILAQQEFEARFGG